MRVEREPRVNALGSCSIVATTSYELTYVEGAGAGSPSSRGELRSAADAERIAKEAATSAASPNARRIVVEGGAAACAGLEGLRRAVVPSSSATSASASSEMARALRDEFALAPR